MTLKYSKGEGYMHTETRETDMDGFFEGVTKHSILQFSSERQTDKGVRDLRNNDRPWLTNKP